MSLVLPVDSSGAGSGTAAFQVRSLLNALALLTLAASEGGDRLDVHAIHREASQLQPLFQSLLPALEQAEVSNVDRQRIRPLQTEAYRRVRLLGVAAMQLRSAKQPETLMKVRSQLQDHLTQLQAFIQGIADVLEVNSEGDGAEGNRPEGDGA